MSKALEMRKIALENDHCSEELVNKYLKICLHHIEFMANRGYTKTDFALFPYNDTIGSYLNDEGIKLFVSKLKANGFNVSNAININGNPIEDMFDIEW